ncbi:MAG: ATP phosphoribosyltransferase regulatory subunit [Clostridiales bacterium]|nr:ATP phosphoribosyltransferase regulatory subunit [Clostridiales bacterium]
MVGKLKLYLPGGVQDYLPDECYNKRMVEERIRKSFFLSGYDEVETPVLEFFDVFAGVKTSIDQESMYKLIDPDGRILVLRPDITMPIARMVGTKLKDKILPLRLSYFGNVYRYGEFQICKQREVAQAGIELLGAEGPEADAEVIAMAIQMFMDLGLKEFQIDIGQVEFFKGIIQEADITPENIEDIRRLIDQKDMLSLERLLKELPISNELKNILYKIPQLYGDSSVLNEAMEISHNAKSQAAIDNIQQVYRIIKDYGFQHYISFDLGMVHSFDFYTGIIFRGITRDLGYPICGGGRYDMLISEFGCDIPATGFAAGIKRLLIAMERQGCLKEIPRVDVLITATEADRGKAYRYMQQLKKAGKRVEMFIPVKSAEEPVAYAKQKGVNKIIKIRGDHIIEYHVD